MRGLYWRPPPGDEHDVLASAHEWENFALKADRKSRLGSFLASSIYFVLAPN